MTQAERILQILREARQRGEGVTNKQFFAEYMPRYNAVIFELKKKGYVITREQVDKNTHLWRLLHEPRTNTELRVLKPETDQRGVFWLNRRKK